MAEPNEVSIAKSTLSDQATSEDSLGFTPYVEAIAEFLVDKDTKPPLTISIEGEWGSGKSSFMQQLANKIKYLEKDQHIRGELKVIEFNAWRHDKAEALWAAFSITFLKEIRKPQNCSISLSWQERLWYVSIGHLKHIVGHFKLIYSRINYEDNRLQLFQATCLTVFLICASLVIPVLFLQKGLKAISSFSEEVVCLLESGTETSKNKKDNNRTSEKQLSQQSQSVQLSKEIGLTSSPSSAQNKAPENVKLKHCQPSSYPWLSNIFLVLLLFGGGIALPGAGFTNLLLKLRDLVRDPKLDLKKYLESPNYKKEVAFVEQFHEDFKKIVDAYTQKDQKVYVFIDDLDRCEVPKSAELMQALNLMIANDPRIIFILGMDRGKVAAGLAFKYKDLLPYLPEFEENPEKNLSGLVFGYTFIEKFIQLQFQMPQASRNNLEVFLNQLSQKNQTNDSDSHKTSLPFWTWIFRKASKEENSTNFSEESFDSSSVETEPQNQQQSQEKSKQKHQEKIKLAVGPDSEHIKNVALMVAPAFDFNPRQVKRFINVFRLQVFIASDTGLFDEVTEAETREPNLTLEQLGKFTALVLRWPLLMADLEQNPSLLKQLERYLINLDEPAEQDSNKVSNKVKYWGNQQALKNLILYGLETKLPEKNLNYSLENLNIEKLLKTSPRVPRHVARAQNISVHAYAQRATGSGTINTPFNKLEESLREGAWREADQETYQLMLQISTDGTERLTIQGLKDFPCKELNTIDQLWVKYSEGKFGFSVQMEIWKECNSPKGYKDNWREFGDIIGCRKNERWISFSDLNFSENAPRGHLPSIINEYLCSTSRSGSVWTVGPFEEVYIDSFFVHVENCALRTRN
jgi:Cdc6-like AAA superfamily ATPase